MSGDGDSDSDSDKDGLGGFGGIADSISDAFSGALSGAADVAAQAGKDMTAAAYTEAADSLTGAGFSNLSGSDTFSPSTGQSTGTTASAAATSTGTSERSSGLGVSSSGREASGPGGFSEGLGPDLTAALNSTALSTQGNLMQPYDPNTAAAFPGALSPDRISTLKDTLTYTAPPDAREVETLNAYASPVGFGAQALERAGRFSKEALPGQAPEYDLSTKRGIAAMVYGKFRAAGYTHEQTAGVLGNIEAESNFNPKAVGDFGKAFGMYQHNDRAPDLKDFAAKRGKDWTDPEVQTDFALHELDTKEIAAARDLKGTTTAREAALSFSREFERPSAQYANNGRRATAAEHYANEFSDLGVPGKQNSFTGELDVALAPAGVELNPIDMPGSAFASHNPSTPTGKERAAPDAQQVTTSTISVEPEQTTQTTAPTVNPHPEQTALGRLETTYLDPEVNTVETVTVTGTPNQPNQSAAAPSTTTTAQQTGQPEQATEETNQGLGPVGRGIVATGVDAAVGMVPGVGIVNGVIAGVNALGDVVGFDMGIPSVGEFVADNIGNVSPGTDPAAPTETDPSEFVNETIEAPEAAAVAAVAASPSNTIQRLENTYMFPTPAERWGANARQYRGA